jgi:hypothetical protein
LNILSEKIARFVQSNRQEYSMSEQISALRRRTIDDMTIRNMSPLTQKAYVGAVKNLSRHFGKSPDQLTFEHVREYRLHLGSRGLGVQAIKMCVPCGSFTERRSARPQCPSRYHWGAGPMHCHPFLQVMKSSVS